MSRLAILRKEKCNPVSCVKECYKFCPMNRTGKECIIEGVDKKPIIDEIICTGCSICVHKCPLKAIEIVKLPEELKKDPIIRHGVNGFALYDLPIPKFGKVVGILGRNGIGKTTSIKILADLLKPNLGDVNKEISYKELIHFFRGSELQTYFEKLEKKEIKISYKPQRVDDMPNEFKGKVRNLLEKVDEKNKLIEIAEELEIEKILDTDIKNISGGELQRVAIAATVLKKANVYYFDEISSYLDIKQRLKVARFIRNLADEETAVLVAEHDLIVLDYVADLVHIMYGKEGCYGVVSRPKSIKTGINAYLVGYLRQENVRFRSKGIKFLGKYVKLKSSLELFSWPELEKKLNSFKLNVNKGGVNENEVIGILGENAIGKTSFVKLLAGILKPDKGKLNLKLKVSYKPQYLQIKKDKLVSDILKSVIKNYKVELVDSLGLEKLFNRKLSELSGGELQKVAIAECLAEEADLMLLDEPSAYLDVEQRLVISKVINEIIERRGISALVVDHDLLFLDYLSSRLLVFDGVPVVEGISYGPYSVEEGMNKLLEKLSISMRKDPETGRPRVNKLDSLLDRKQKREKRLYYS